MSKKFDFCVFIGRCQPPHKQHILNIQRALDIADRVIVILGSHRAARNIKNPWTTREREEMIRGCLKPDVQGRLIFKSVRDYYYNDNVWVADVQQKVAEVTEEYSKIALIGMHKDHSSYYLDLFPQWTRESVPDINNVLNATDIRNLFFNRDIEDKFNKLAIKDVDASVVDYLIKWKSGNDELYTKLAEEWKFIQEYKTMWAQAPYPVTFVTTDVVVVKAGHVLMVRRKANPGKGLLALPGGFLQQNVRIIDSALKELKEETRIKLHANAIMQSLKDERVFDHPSRSLRGRTITHAFYFELPAGGDLPLVKGDDDAEHAMWIPITELFSREDEVYEDHLHIVNFFYGKGSR